MPCILPVSVAKCCVWLLVVPNKPRLHLLLQFLKGYVLQIVVKPFLVGAVRSFNFAVVPWCIRSNKLVLYAEPLHYPVGNMNLTVARPFGVRELRSVVGLNCDRRVPEVQHRPLYEVGGRITAVFLVCVNKTLAGGFVNHCVLKRPLERVFARVANSGYKLYVHLPLLPEHFGRVVRLRHVAVVYLGGAQA